MVEALEFMPGLLVYYRQVGAYGCTPLPAIGFFMVLGRYPFLFSYSVTVIVPDIPSPPGAP